MALVSVSVDAFLLASALILAPSLYFIRRQPPDAPYRTQLSLLLVAHTLYIIYSLLFFWPPNIFQRLRLPLNAPTEKVRSLLLERAGLGADATLPKPLETLLTRLSSFDMRTLYVRFGQAVVQDCEHCKTFDEYALFALPRALLEYIREACVLGLLTVTGSGRERWRVHTIGALVCVAVLEGYSIATATIHIPRNGLKVFMWHDRLWLLRHVLFLFLALLTHFLPPAPFPAPSPTATLATARAALEQGMTRLASLRYARGAVLREPALRAAAGAWWARQREEGLCAREDPGVQHVSERLGRGFQEAEEGRPEGRLRTVALSAVGTLRGGLVAPP
ncbi:hypothetical protein B0H21DRAFT_892786 [Amylocystis lapponica]|nr:hypothetical protein B0H21DRAFT_892786 [Amylocystis lapponica]